jgi:GNAT superfamily N-acetyltransferase
MPRIRDAALVRPVLRRDPAWSLYALADLSPEHSAHAEWYAPDESGRCAVLLYRGFGFPIFLDSGDFDAVAETIAELDGEQGFYLSTRQPTLELLREAGYEVPAPKRMLRMRLDRARFDPEPPEAAIRLVPADLPALKTLYADGAARGESPEFFLDSMLTTGVYYAVRAEDGFAAAAGTHVLTPGEDVAGVGNIYTRQGLRRQGHARQATTAVLSELVNRGIGTICLNVATENTAAIALYRSLGFDLHSEYIEGEARLGPGYSLHLQRK